MKIRLHIYIFIFTFAALCFAGSAYSDTKTSVGTGSWGTSGTWSPSGVPASGDNVIIANGHTVTVNNNYTITDVTVNTGGTLTFSSNKRLTINGNITVNGTVTQNNGNITLTNSGSAFTIGAGGSFTWQPYTNNSSNATLFTNGVENFAATSTLIIKKWYDFSVALGSVVTGNFGNLTLNSNNMGGSIYEWNQNNQFALHQVLGTLKIDQGWIVLDKSGSISTTDIGNINLVNGNSYLDGHGGTHSGSFTIITDSIVNNGGTFTGIYNGNGNITLNVEGNITNTGDFYLIQNSGVSGVGNGNGTLTVGGTYTQTAGDFRGIYNSTTYSAGLVNITMQKLCFSGGIFMGHYACHTSGGQNTMTITGNVTVAYGSSSHIFRGIGMTSLSGTLNNSRFNWIIGGNLSVSGNSSADFTSHAGSGTEIFTITGNVTVSGGYGGWNYGAPSGAHASSLTFNGNMSISGGSLFLSTVGGTATATLAGSFTQSGGTFVIAGDTGTTTFAIAGDLSMSGGTFKILNNPSSSAAANPVLNLAGNLSITGGTFNMSSYAGSTSGNGKGILNLTGSLTVGLLGTITESSATVGAGELNFVKAGSQQYVKTGTISNTINYTVSGETSINPGSDAFTGSGSFTLSSGSTLMVGSALGITSSGMLGNVQVTGSRNFSSSANYNFCGSSVQVTGNGLPSTVNNLTINNSSGVTLSASTTVSNSLTLTNGKITTGNYELNVSNTSPGAISGYSLSNYIVGNLRRSIAANGTYPFPVGCAANSELITVTLNGVSGVSNILAYFTNANPIESLLPVSVTIGSSVINEMLDYGYWTLTPDASLSGGTYDVTVNMKGHTNPAQNPMSYCLLKRDNPSYSWQSLGVHDNLTQSENGGVASVTRSAFTSFSNYGIGRGSGALPVEFLRFEAKLSGGTVQLLWATASEKNNDYFTVERSDNGQDFEAMGTVDGAGNSTSVLKYLFDDNKPLKGISYYRIKQTDFDGKFDYSNIAVVRNEETSGAAAEISSVFPNPFNDKFSVSYSLESAQEVDLIFMNAAGQVVFSEKILAESGNNQFNWEDNKNLPKGNYFITLIAGENKVTKKLVKN